MAAKRPPKAPKSPIFMSPAAQDAAGPDDPVDLESAGILPLDPDGPNSYGAWRAAIKKAQQTIEDLQGAWDSRQREYMQDTSLKRTGARDHLKIPACYTYTEQKKSQLVAQLPRLVVTAKTPESVTAAPLVQAVMNDLVSMAQPDGVDAMAMLRSILHDALVPSGIFACHIGYEMIADGTKSMQTGTQPPDPMNPGAPPEPIMEDVPNVVFERYFMDRITPSKLLIFDDRTDSADYDRADRTGFEFVLDLNLSKLKWPTIPDEFEGMVGDDKHVINADADEHRDQRPESRHVVRGWQLYYRTAVFDPTVKHPYKQRSLVLIEGLKRPVFHKDAPYQWENTDGTLGGMVGFPLHIGALRCISDSAFPPSDTAFAMDLFQEVSEGSSLMRQNRKRSVPQRVANSATMEETDLGKFEKGDTQAIIPLGGKNFQDGKFVGVQPVELAHLPQEDFTFFQIATRGLQDVYGLGAAPTGALPEGTASTSATQAGAAQSSSASRVGLDRNVLMAWYARACEKLLPLVQHFMTTPQYVNLLGPNDAMSLTQWTKDNIQGKFAFSVLPNSSVDLSEQRQEEMTWYTVAARAPDINRRALDTEMVRAFGKDPAQLIMPPPPPPPPKPELPKGMNFAIDEKLNPLAPAFPMILSMLKQWGWQFDPQMIADMQKQTMEAGMPPTAVGNVQNGVVLPPPPGIPGAPPPGAPPNVQPQNGGAVERAEPIDKHVSDVKGALPGPQIGPH